MIRLFRILFLLMSAAAILAGGAFFWLKGEFGKPGPLSVEKAVVIPRGLGVDGIAMLLHQQGVIADADVFRFAVRLERPQPVLRAGEFMFPASVSSRGAMDVLVNAAPVRRRITIPEGLTTIQALEIVAATDGLDGQVPADVPEGVLLPETYYFAYGDTRMDIVDRMESSARAAVEELWERRVENLPVDSPEEAVILASIVEKETGIAGERELVASVFVNRLRKGMRLQSDPTVVYAVTGGAGPLGRSITKTDLAIDSPYNTYRNAGLPPGPIANPGKASIAAVLNPAETDFLYFVADGSGGHVFSRTLAEHNRNVAKWRRLRRQQQAN